MSAPRVAVTAASNSFKNPSLPSGSWLFLELREVLGKLRNAFAKGVIGLELLVVFIKELFFS